MKTAIRKSTFETNSSSVHTLILVPYDLADRWREMGSDWWLDMSAVESDAKQSGFGYGDIDMMSAPANENHLVSRTSLEERGEWRTPGAYEDNIYANWMLSLDVIDNPSAYVDDYWSSIYSVDESDEGYVVMID